MKTPHQPPGSHQSKAKDTSQVRHTEFWDRMEHALGASYARTWARDHVVGSLGDKTVQDALGAGEDPKAVWRAVWRELELPFSDR